MKGPNGRTRTQGTVATLALLTVFGWGVVTCSEYDSSLLHYSASGHDASTQDGALQPDGPESDSPTEAQSDVVLLDSAQESSSPTCQSCPGQSLARAPCPPSISNPEAGPTLVFAMRTARLGAAKSNPNDWASLGLDVDCVFTRSNGSPASCQNSAGDQSVIEDGLLGRDNSFGRNVGGALRLMALFGVLPYDMEAQGNEGLETGRNSMLFAVSDMGTGPDDPRLTFAMYISPGTRDGSGEEVTAKWDGTDIWSIESTCLSPLGEPLYVDDVAYLSGNQIVAHLPDGLPIRFSSHKSQLELALNRTTVVLTLSEDHTRVTEGVLSGLWRTATALTALDGYTAQMGICSNQPEYAAARNIIAGASDTRLDLNSDTSLPCNAMSFGMNFTAQLAQTGPIIPPVPPDPSQCGDAGADASPADAATDARADAH